MTSPPAKPLNWKMVLLFVLSAAVFFDGIRSLFITDCSEYLVSSSSRYAGMGKGMARVCETFGPIAPASLEILLGALMLTGLWFARRER